MSAMSFGPTVSLEKLPERALEPELARRCLRAGPLPGPEAANGPFVVFEECAWVAMLTAARSDLRREQIGVFHGSAHTNRGITWIHVRHSLHAMHAQGTPVHASLDQRAWDALHTAALGRGIDTEADPVVGWWHTHPDLGAFFSGIDRRTQAAAFERPWHVALVIDPVRREIARFVGPRSEPLPAAPLVLGAAFRGRIPLPALAVALPLPRSAPDLRTSAWRTLGTAARGARFLPLPATDHALADLSPALVFDRPHLKAKSPEARLALSAPPRTADGAFEAAVPLSPSDVVALLIAGRSRPVLDLFANGDLP